MNIHDLDDFDDPVRAVKEVWDPTAEIEAWSREARVRQIQWETRHLWNATRTAERVHPSSLEKLCDNYLYLELLGAGRHPKSMGKTTGVFDMGTACHLVFDYLMETRAMVKDYVHVSEFKVKKFPNAVKLRMCGSADGYSERVIKDIELRILWELKSMSGSQFSLLGSHPKKANLVQSHAYAWCADIPIIVVVYMNKENGSVRCFVEPFSPPLWRPSKDRVKRLVETAMNPALIQSVEKHITKSCRYCDLLEECNPDPERFGVKKEDGWLKKSKRTRALRKPRTSTE